ncbi:hypothetical protein LTR17_026832 [Elasticomyces elasticus]|nr:hypothetical protein LTR17_026832 [Elasticomyces elasticus]
MKVCSNKDKASSKGKGVAATTGGARRNGITRSSGFTESQHAMKDKGCMKNKGRMKDKGRMKSKDHAKSEHHARNPDDYHPPASPQRRPITYAAPGQPDRLSGMPAEIRNDVWGRVLQDKIRLNTLSARMVLTNTRNQGWGYTISQISGVLHDEEVSHRSAPALLKVSQLIPSDARKFDIARTNFIFDLFCPSDLNGFQRWWDSLGMDAQYVRSLQIDGVRATTPPCLTRQLITFTVAANNSMSATVQGVVIVGNLPWRYDVSADADSLRNRLQAAVAANDQQARCRSIRDAVVGFVQQRGYDLTWPA